MKQRGLKSLALLSITALVLSNLSLHLFSSSQQLQEEELSYDEILTHISRRLAFTSSSPSNTRLARIRSHHAQLLIERGLDPHSTRFKELLRERMKRVNAVRAERGEERKVLRGLQLGEEVWRGTPLVVFEKVSFFFCPLSLMVCIQTACCIG